MRNEADFLGMADKLLIVRKNRNGIRIQSFTARRRLGSFAKGTANAHRLVGFRVAGASPPYTDSAKVLGEVIAVEHT